LGGGTISLPIIYFVPLRGDYIQMLLFLRTPKWESQNWNSYCLKFLDIHVFFNLSIFWAHNGFILAHKKIFLAVYSTLQLDLIWPLLSRDLWNFTLALSFDHNSCKSSWNEQCESTLSIYTSRPFKWCPRGPIWCLFAFPTKAPNIRNSHMNATLKVGVHFGVIGLHPLHFPPFVRMCFTLPHTFGLMGPCTSHLVANSMLGLRHCGYWIQNFWFIIIPIWTYIG